ncbi:MAG: DUF1549 domain-containing protein, partial [Verrucomicrobiales bacterium]|nr:DUF1549 domain-containing protein [Verrucomicrobiales bacterium]
MPQLRKILFFALAIIGSPAQAVDTNANLAYFEKHVRPLLADQCYQCHSATKSLGGLRLDTRAGWLHGGASGNPAIIPGKPDTSPLVQHLTATSPTDGHAIKPADLATLTRWVKMGAPDPRSGDTTNRAAIDIDAGRSFWSFRPIKNPPPPKVSNTSWPLNDIDHFILARLEAKNLTPAPDAAPEALARRRHFDLTGLPPSFSDPGTSIDDLLASPQFGVRWARHRLDIARYAESSGGGRAILFPDAWRYRDYVVDTFNRDVPFDHFIRQQLAGDLLPHTTTKQRADNLTATAFLAIGPTNFELQDKDLLDMDVIDEQLETFSRAFLGMTVGCARCHDHKFDPIPTSDYYALAGIFKST